MFWLRFLYDCCILFSILQINTFNSQHLRKSHIELRALNNLHKSIDYKINWKIYECEKKINTTFNENVNKTIKEYLNNYFS